MINEQVIKNALSLFAQRVLSLSPTTPHQLEMWSNTFFCCPRPPPSFPLPVPLPPPSGPFGFPWMRDQSVHSSSSTLYKQHVQHHMHIVHRTYHFPGNINLQLVDFMSTAVAAVDMFLFMIRFYRNILQIYTTGRNICLVICLPWCWHTIKTLPRCPAT